MRICCIVCVVLFAVGCSGPKAPVAAKFVPAADETKHESVAAAPSKEDEPDIPAEPAATPEPAASSEKAPPVPAVQDPESKPKEDAEEGAEPTVKPLTEKEQDELLGKRLEGGFGLTFRQFANMFLVKSRLDLGYGIGLMTPSKKIMLAELQPVFPESYQPTLREFLDAIALQTFSQWKYDSSSKYFKSDAKRGDPVAGIAIFEFTETERQKPFEVTLAEAWKIEDKGHWQMHVPPDFPVGLDIYEMGTYSADDAADQEKLLKKVRTDVARQWAGRVSENFAEKDFRDAKVGTYEALYFEAMIPSQFGKKLRWRQWVFMVENKCYFVVSTIFPELEEKIFPDVEKMLASFRVKVKAS